MVKLLYLVGMTIALCMLRQMLFVLSQRQLSSRWCRKTNSGIVVTLNSMDC